MPPTTLEQTYAAEQKQVPDVSTQAEQFEAAGLGQRQDYRATPDQQDMLGGAIAAERQPDPLALPSVETSDAAREDVGRAVAGAQELEQGMGQQRSATQEDQGYDDQYQDVIDGLGEVDEELADVMDNYVSEVNNIMSGDFPFTEIEQAQMDEISERYTNLEKLQYIANRNYEGGIGIQSRMSGRQRYAQELYQDDMRNAVQDGLSRVKDINAQASREMNELRAAIQDNRVDDITDKYNLVMQSLGQRQDVLNDIRDTISAAEKNQREIDDQNKTEARFEYEYLVNIGEIDPDNMSYFQYINTMKGRSGSSSVGTAGAGGVNTTGASNTQRLQDMDRSTPPAWFTEQFIMGGTSEDVLAPKALRKQNKRGKKGKRIRELTLDGGIDSGFDLPGGGEAEGGWAQLSSGALQDAWDNFRNSADAKSYKAMLDGAASEARSYDVPTSGGSGVDDIVNIVYE